MPFPILCRCNLSLVFFNLSPAIFSNGIYLQQIILRSRSIIQVPQFCFPKMSSTFRLVNPLMYIYIYDLGFSWQWPWRMASSVMLCRVAFVRTDDSEELSASIIRVTRVGELGTTLAVTSNWHVLWRNTKGVLVHRFFSPWWRRR
jgi:hypothetical protein